MYTTAMAKSKRQNITNYESLHTPPEKNYATTMAKSKSWNGAANLMGISKQLMRAKFKMLRYDDSNFIGAMLRSSYLFADFSYLNEYCSYTNYTKM